MSEPERVAYGDWSLDLHRKVIAGRVPATGTIEVTRRCNLSCSHCYNNLPMTDGEALSGELTLDEHRRIADEVAEAGCLWLLYSGGEIFARKDFLDIYRHARKQGLLLTLFTNGTIVTPRIADALAEQPPFALEITLYGRTRETYEALTRSPGSYDRCLKGIELLLERKLPLKLKTVAVSVNAHEVWEMKSFAQELGCEFSFDSMINPRIDCSLSPLAVRLTPREIVELDLRDPARVREWDRFAGAFLAPPQPPDKTDEVYHCGGGVSSFAVDPAGKMSICILSHQEKFDLRRGSFREGWELFLRGVRAKFVKELTFHD
jgi:MoaA/NifB/PqqE/SkfB family radical SAM enzyme